MPFDNIDLKEIRDLQNLWQRFFWENDFEGILKNTIKKIRTHESPKKRSRNKQKVLKDQKYCFKLGEEEDNRSEIKCPPHSPECYLTSHYRFGLKRKPNSGVKFYHYDVTKVDSEKHFDGEFFVCHGQEKESFSKATHLNMYNNNYFIKK